MLKPFLAFDVDGTIFKSALTEKVVEYGVAEGLFDTEAFNDAYDTRQRWQAHNNEDTYQIYLKQLVGALVIQMSGVDVEHFNKVAARVMEAHSVRKFSLPRIMIDKFADTHFPVVISGSPEMLVRPFVADLGFVGVYGSSYQIENGRFTGIAESVGNKALILQELVDSGGLAKEGSIAIGDTVSDVPMLEYADHPVMFNPSRTLREYGERFGWDKAYEVKDNIEVLSMDPDVPRYCERTLDDFLSSLRSPRQT